MGGIFYIALATAAVSMVAACVIQRDERDRRMKIIEKLESIPFGTLAFNVEMTCAVCFEDFAA